MCETKVSSYSRSGEWEAVHRGMTVKKKAEKSVAREKEELGYQIVNTLEQGRWEALDDTPWIGKQEQDMR